MEDLNSAFPAGCQHLVKSGYLPTPRQIRKCGRPSLPGDARGDCIFHSREALKPGFIMAFRDVVQETNESPEITLLDLNGCVFPPIKITGLTFKKHVILTNSLFTSNTVISKCTFAGSLLLTGSTFAESVLFRQVHFLKKAKLMKCTFQRASFSDCTFQRVLFTRSNFNDVAHFSGIKFQGTAEFRLTRFLSDAYFRANRFLDMAMFYGSVFRGRLDFRWSIFVNELEMDGCTIGLLKNVDAPKMSFDNATFEAAPFWKTSKLERYSFRESFLFSMNLANKEIVDCDFTGAVFKAVLTQGWKPDMRTIKNTHYIYTDYEIVQTQDVNNDTVREYKRLEESRVPAEGVFGQGEHLHFTIADYLKEPLKWSLALNVPAQFRTAVLNYIQFFTDFMKVTEGVSLEIRTRQEGSKLRVEFMTDTEDDKELVQARFEEYRENTTKEFTALDVRFNSDASPVEKELFKIRYEHTINSLKTELSYTQRLLQKEEEKNALQERYSSLLREASVFSREPARLLMPAGEPTLQRSQTPIFFLTADLKDYSTATRENNRLYPQIQAFLFDQKERIQRDPVCDAVKLEGDAIKVFCRDGVKLVWIAKRLISDFENRKYDQPSPIKGFRIVLGYGTAFREQRGNEVDYSGDPIVETCRVDQPMKRYIEEHKEEPTQVWSTEAFQTQLLGKHSNVVFEELPPMDLDKEYQSGVRLFRVKIE